MERQRERERQPHGSGNSQTSHRYGQCTGLLNLSQSLMLYRLSILAQALQTAIENSFCLPVTYVWCYCGCCRFPPAAVLRSPSIARWRSPSKLINCSQQKCRLFRHVYITVTLDSSLCAWVLFMFALPPGYELVFVPRTNCRLIFLIRCGARCELDDIWILCFSAIFHAWWKCVLKLWPLCEFMTQFRTKLHWHEDERSTNIIKWAECPTILTKPTCACGRQSAWNSFAEARRLMVSNERSASRGTGNGLEIRYMLWWTSKADTDRTI